jgi:hypothetical protein
MRSYMYSSSLTSSRSERVTMSAAVDVKEAAVRPVEVAEAL